jgi:prevent-host-death family protein
MRFASVAQVKDGLSQCLARARKKNEPIVVTHHGKPYALIQPLSEDDLEELKTLIKRVLGSLHSADLALVEHGFREAFGL